MKATISRTSPRYYVWNHIFQSDTISILEPPKVGDQGQRRMLVDISALDAGQLQRLIIQFARSWRLPSDRVRTEITKSGSVAISAEDVIVTEEEARLF